MESLEFEGRRLKVLARGDTGSANPTLVILGGLLADQLEPTSRAQVIADLALERGYRCIRFNYSGHGLTESTTSDGSFAEVSMSRLLQDSLAVCRTISEGPLALVGSSVGGGLMPYISKELADSGREVTAVFGISAVPPIALRSFVLAQVRGDDKTRFDRGEPVRITSPTLPVPIEIRREQIADLDSFAPIGGLAPPPAIGHFIFGGSDVLSSESYNVALASTFRVEARSVYRVQDGHDIDGSLMSHHLRLWLDEIEGKT